MKKIALVKKLRKGVPKKKGSKTLKKRPIRRSRPKQLRIAPGSALRAPTEMDYAIVSTWLGGGRKTRDTFRQALTPSGKLLLYFSLQERMPAYHEAFNAARRLKGRARERRLAQISEEYDVPLRELFTLLFSPDAMGV